MSYNMERFMMLKDVQMKTPLFNRVSNELFQYHLVQGKQLLLIAYTNTENGFGMKAK